MSNVVSLGTKKKQFKSIKLAADLQDIINCLWLNGMTETVQANVIDIRYALVLSWSEALEDEVFKLIKHRLAQ